MGKHEKEDDAKRYEGNGYDPHRSIPPKDPGGEHGKPDRDDGDAGTKK